MNDLRRNRPCSFNDCRGLGTVTVPSYSFNDCRGLGTVTVPSCSFNDCRGLGTVTVPSCSFNDCRGLGTVTVPSGVQGQSPCMNCAFSQSKFSQKICATRTKPPRRGDLGRAAARLARLCHGKCLDKKPDHSDIQLFVRHKARIGFFSKPNNLLPALGRAAALQECPCGAFWARCAHLLRKWASGKARPLHAGALPLHPTGDRDGPQAPAIVLKD